jgi:hypothetical protein
MLVSELGGKILGTTETLVPWYTSVYTSNHLVMNLIGSTFKGAHCMNNSWLRSFLCATWTMRHDAWSTPLVTSQENAMVPYMASADCIMFHWNFACFDFRPRSEIFPVFSDSLFIITWLAGKGSSSFSRGKKVLHVSKNTNSAYYIVDAWPTPGPWWCDKVLGDYGHFNWSAGFLPN